MVSGPGDCRKPAHFPFGSLDVEAGFFDERPEAPVDPVAQMVAAPGPVAERDRVLVDPSRVADPARGLVVGDDPAISRSTRRAFLEPT